MEEKKKIQKIFSVEELKKLKANLLDQATRTLESFSKYQAQMLTIVFAYIGTFLIWAFITVVITKILGEDSSTNTNKILSLRRSDFWNLTFTLLMTVFQAVIFCFDGYISSWIKTPFNQFAFDVNTGKLFSRKEKWKILDLAGSANEHLRETLKKFGLFSFLSSVSDLLIKGTNVIEASKQSDQPRLYHLIINLAYLVPISLAFYNILKTKKNLQKTQQQIIKNFVNFLEKKTHILEEKEKNIKDKKIGFE